jgi:cell division protein FtsW (lipid II flippase)
MRVIATPPDAVVVRRRAPNATRAANIEFLGLTVSTIVVLLGLALTYIGQTRLAATERNPQTGGVLNVTQLRSPDPLVPLLTMFEAPAERQAVARALYARSVDAPALQHVGGLASVTFPADVVRRDARFGELRARLARHPGLEAVPVLTATDIAGLKPHLSVRTGEEFAARIRRAALWFFGTFWLAYAFRRWRGVADDPLLMPILMLLCGIGFMTMVALRDPLRDTIAASTFVEGVAGGLILLVAASHVDWEASMLRRAVLGPLTLALCVAALLLVFGTGPGSSGVKVNLLGVQPVEVIRLLVVLALSAYFARRLEFLRELSEPATPDRPWLRHVRVPRLRDVRPVLVSMLLVLAFFFLQKDLGPALVLSCVFLGLYGIARGRAAFVVVGVLLLLGGFTAAYWVGFPTTVRQRVAIWLDPWANGVPGGDQIAHGLWALSTGALWGSGPGLGNPGLIPAGHTDFVLAAVGEELGFIGLLVVIVLYALLCWRCLRVALRAPGDYTAFLAIGIALALIVQAFVIASGLLGLLPLSGVVTPFLSYGRSSMLANLFAVGVLMAIARRRGPVRRHLYQPVRVLAFVLAAFGAAVVVRAGWVQVARADTVATASTLSEQADGGFRFSYNPRLLTVSRLLVRGTIYDRNGLPLATSRPDEMQKIPELYRAAGVVPQQTCSPDSPRCYPLGGLAFALLGNWTTQVNWGARNSSYVERDSDVLLKGYDDRQRVVDVVNPRTGRKERVVQRDYRELLPLVRHHLGAQSDAARALLARNRDVHTTFDARLQVRASAALRSRMQAGGYGKGGAIVLDANTGEVLASVSYPWPEPADFDPAASPPLDEDLSDRLFDRPRYGLYPPGSTFKLLVAGAALRANRTDRDATFMCIRLPDGRVGNYVRGSTRPVRDDVLDVTPHGMVNLRRGLVVSCNAYFAQLAVRIGPRPIVDAASLFQIDVARPGTAEGLRPLLPQAGYGQGQVVVSPLKMARIAGAIATRGVVTPVRWVKAPESTAAAPPRFLSESDAALLSQYMREVVTGGTGRSVASNATAIAGKTGTAETGDGPAHSWFAGFAPYGGAGRKIAFSVVVERAGYGARAAAPVAGDLVTAARETGIIR